MPRKGQAEDTKDALVNAVLELMGQKSVAGISVKDIARRAKVNHGLVHRYFGSKEGLVREAVMRAAAMVNKGADSDAHTTWTAELLAEHPELARIVARVCLDGPRDLLDLAAPPPKLLATYVGKTRAMLERMGIEGIDPHVVNAAGVATLLGWIVFKPLFKKRYGLPRDADAQLRTLAALADAFLASGAGK